MKPVPVTERMASFDFGVMAVFSVLAFPLLSRSRRIGRLQGAIMLGGYCAYIGYSYLAR